MHGSLFLSLAVFVSLLIAPASIFAAPFKMAENNPQVVAYYEEGPHGKPAETEGNHEGIDLVKQNGKSGNFQAWFYGTYPAGRVGLHGHHSVWKVSKDGTCPQNSTLVVNAHPGWGEYLEADVNYCVFDNTFKEQK